MGRQGKRGRGIEGCRIDWPAMRRPPRDWQKSLSLDAKKRIKRKVHSLPCLFSSSSSSFPTRTQTLFLSVYLSSSLSEQHKRSKQWHPLEDSRKQEPVLFHGCLRCSAFWSSRRSAQLLLTPARGDGNQQKTKQNKKGRSNSITSVFETERHTTTEIEPEEARCQCFLS